jgi:hypothetical protein
MSVQGRQAADMKGPYVDEERLAFPPLVYVSQSA